LQALFLIGESLITAEKTVGSGFFTLALLVKIVALE
jgi:hypothetical protein